MIRLTNKKEHQQQVVYVDRPVVQHVEVEKHVASEPQIIIQDREVIKEVPVEKLVVQKEVEHIDLAPLHIRLDTKDREIDKLQSESQQHLKRAQMVANELEMQRQALVGLKMQRDVDRKRRLMLINRIKKEHNAHKSLNLKLKLAIGASILLSIVSLIVKL